MSKKHTLKRYLSIREFAEAAAKGQADAVKNGRKSSADQRDHGDWAGTAKSFEEAYTLATRGWEAGYRSIRATMDKVMPRVREKVDPAAVLVPDHYGELYDIGEYLSGNPEYAWDEVYEENQAQAKVITVLISGSLVWTVSPEDVLFRGSLVLSAMEAIEMLGHQMEVWAEVTIIGDTEWGGGEPPIDSTLVRAKAAGEPVDMKSYAFTCDPGWHRRLTFGVQEGWPAAKRKEFGIHSWYGRPSGPRCDKMVGASLVFDLGTHHGWPKREDDPEVHCQWVIDTLESLESKLKVGWDAEGGGGLGA